MKSGNLQILPATPCVMNFRSQTYIMFSLPRTSCHSYYTSNHKISVFLLFFFTYTLCVLISKFFYSPTDPQVNCLKNNFKIYIKINIKTAPTCFGAVTPSSGSALLIMRSLMMVNFKIVFKIIHLPHQLVGWGVGGNFDTRSVFLNHAKNSSHKPPPAQRLR